MHTIYEFVLEMHFLV